MLPVINRMLNKTERYTIQHIPKEEVNFKQYILYTFYLLIRFLIKIKKDDKNNQKSKSKNVFKNFAKVILLF